MQVFITGGSGYVGSAVIPELLGAGHEVVGLARSDASAAALETLGAKVHRGSLDDLDSLREAASASDGVIHVAYRVGEIRAGNFEGANDADMRAIEALGAALAGTDKPFVGTSITLTITFSGIEGVGTESDAATAGLRAEAENAMIALAERGVRSSVVRLPPAVYRLSRSQRLHPGSDRHRSREGPRRFRRRWVESLVCGSHPRCGTPLPPGD